MADVLQLSPNHFLVRVFNIPHDTVPKTLQDTLTNALQAHEGLKNIAFQHNPAKSSTALLRLKSNAEADVRALRESIEKLPLYEKIALISQPLPLRKPALFIRNLSGVSQPTFDALFEQVKESVERVEWNFVSKDVRGDLAIVYFSSEAVALATLQQIKGITLEGKRISAVFRYAVHLKPCIFYEFLFAI